MGTGATGTFDSKNAGTGKAVSVSGFSITGADAGNYTLAQPSNVTANITKKSLTVSGTSVADKVYDGTYSYGVVTFGNLEGVVEGDKLNLSGQVDQFYKDVGVYGTFVYYAVSGLEVQNYQLSQAKKVVSAQITPRALTVTGTILSDKVYDGTTSAGSIQNNGTLQNVVEGEIIDLKANAANLSGKDVGTRTSTVSYTLSDVEGLASNYTVADNTVNNVVTKRTLTVQNTSLASKVYDGTTKAGNLTLGTLVNLVAGETLNLTGSVGTLSGKDAGTQTAKVSYTLSNGTTPSSGSGPSAPPAPGSPSSPNGLASNYDLADQTVNNVITPKALAIAGTSLANKVFDGTTNPGALTMGEVSGFVGNEKLKPTGKVGPLSGIGPGLMTAKIDYTLSTASGSLTLTNSSNYSLMSGVLDNLVITVSNPDGSYSWQTAVGTKNAVSEYRAERLRFDAISVNVSNSYDTPDIVNFRKWRDNK